ncbi:MAG: 50S ribosomal protein L22 [Candidatus Pacebacteria bacterium]|nr:50S ribosomal protein L22 [Candidatus Paceibacterota bacterium]
MSTALLNKYQQSPRKVRLVADLVRGKKVKQVLPVLDVLGKRAAVPMKKLILSAVSNAVHNHGADKDRLVIEEIRVDESPTLKRWRPRARGRAFPIRKRTSRIFVRLEEYTVVDKETEEKEAKELKPKTIKKEKKD